MVWMENSRCDFRSYFLRLSPPKSRHRSSPILLHERLVAGQSRSDFGGKPLANNNLSPSSLASLLSLEFALRQRSWVEIQIRTALLPNQLIMHRHLPKITGMGPMIQV